MADMNGRNHSLSFVIIIPFLLMVLFGYNLHAAPNFGQSPASGNNFGAVSQAAPTAAATAAWIEGSVRESNGVLVIRSNGASTDLNPDDYGGEEGFIWKTMVRLTEKGGVMTKEQISELAKTIIVKYLQNIDAWPKMKALLKSWNITDEEELKSLQTIYQESFPREFTKENYEENYGKLKNLYRLSEKKTDDANNNKAVSELLPVKETALGFVGKYDEKLKKFVVEPALSYQKGMLINEKTGKEISASTVENNPMVYRRIYSGTRTGTAEITIIGDEQGLKRLDDAVNRVKKEGIWKKEYNDGRNSDGTISPDYFNCLNYSDETQKALEIYGIDEIYTVGLVGKIKESGKDQILAYDHAVNAVKVGDIKYSDGNIYPTFAIINPQTGEVMGQLGGFGTPLTYTFSNAGETIAIENAVVIKDFVLTNGVAQYADVKSKNIYTFTVSPVIEVTNYEKLKINNKETALITTDYPPSGSIMSNGERVTEKRKENNDEFTKRLNMIEKRNQQIRSDIQKNYNSERNLIFVCDSDGNKCTQNNEIKDSNAAADYFSQLAANMYVKITDKNGNLVYDSNTISY